MFWIRFLKLLPALLATGKLALVKVSYMSATLYSLSESSEQVDVPVLRPPETFTRCLTGVKTMFCTGCGFTCRLFDAPEPMVTVVE